MRDKNYNTGVRGVLLDVQHYEKMGSALWLYSWLVLRHTHQSGSIGWVLGGAPVSYREIEEETGFNRRTLESWFRKLRRGGYIETSAAPSGVVVRITKSKKFAQTSRRIAEGARGFAGPPTRNCVAIGSEDPSIEQVPGRIGSSSLVRIKDKIFPRANQKHFHKEIHNHKQNHQQNPSGLEEMQQPISTNYTAGDEFEDRLHNLEKHFSFDARYSRRLLQRKRDEAVRRELRVGTGPEVRRS